MVEDNDGHWYLIPAKEEQDFDQWIAMMEDDTFDDGENPYEGPDFESCRIFGSPSNITFSDPQED